MIQPWEAWWDERRRIRDAAPAMLEALRGIRDDMVVGRWENGLANGDMVGPHALQRVAAVLATIDGK